MMMRCRGFALLDVFLACLLLVLISYGSYAVVQSYQRRIAVNDVLSKVSTITQAYLPYLEQAGVEDATNPIITGSGALDSTFASLHSVDLDSQGYVCTAVLNGSGLQSALSFSDKTLSQSEFSNQHALIIGFEAKGIYLSALRAALAPKFSVLVASGSSVSIKTARVSLSAADIDAKDSYSVYVVYPKEDNANNGSDSDIAVQDESDFLLKAEHCT
jgi:hypothetical protein